jgi:hypothetical protein
MGEASTEGCFCRSQFPSDAKGVPNLGPRPSLQVFDSLATVKIDIQLLRNAQGQPSEFLRWSYVLESFNSALLESRLCERPGLKAWMVAKQQLPAFGRLAQEKLKPSRRFGLFASKSCLVEGDHAGAAVERSFVYPRGPYRLVEDAQALCELAV